MQRLFGTIARIVGLIQTSSVPHMKTIQIRAVLFQDADNWCAQCLEHDIATEADSLDALRTELETAIAIHAEIALQRGQEPFESLPPAPDRFFRMFERFEREHGREEDHQIALDSSIASCVMARFAYPEASLN